jgi:hypothetical protein
VVDAREKFGNVAFKDIIASPSSFSQLDAVKNMVYPGMGPETLPAGEGFIDKTPLKERLYNLYQRMMDDAIPKGRRGDKP